MTGYIRPASLADALALLDGGAVPFGGGTDLAGQADRGISSPELLVDLRDTGLGGIEAYDGGLRIGAAVTLAELAASTLVEGYAAVRTAASLAASPLLRNLGTVGGNLCQHTRCWYYRGEEWHCWLGGGRRASRRSVTTASTASSPETASRPTRPTSRRRWPRATP